MDQQLRRIGWTQPIKNRKKCISFSRIEGKHEAVAAQPGTSTGLLKLERLGSLRINPIEQDNHQQSKETYWG